ncbi:MAG: DUF2997 domain-containing protein [Planctomycetes bacterium]|jgi:hypothetical protein|nr:DUF2997 domain-containing protein [Planctomycetota bacterium]
MADKKIVIDINDKGEIKAETFGLQGTECLIELDKLLKDLALETTTMKKEEFFKEGITTTNTVKAKNI